MAKSKSKAKKANPSWTPEAEVFLLNWLDDNNGPEGGLRLNEEQTLDKLIADENFQKLLPILTESIATDEKKEIIVRRLKWFWSRFRLPLYKKAPYTKTSLYEKGSAIFDWNELEAKFPGLYTDTEFEERKKRAGLGTPSLQETDNKRKSLDGEGHEHNGHEPEKRQRTLTDGAPHADLIASSSSQKHGPGDVGSSTQQRLRRQAPALPTIQAEERRANQESMLPNADFAKLPRIQRLLGRLGDEQTDLTPPDETPRDLMKIYVRIEKTVSWYLEGSNIDDDRQVILEPKSAYPRKLVEMMGLILGGLADSVDDRCKLFQHLQTEKFIGYGIFLRSLLATAVKTWCLDEVLVEKDIYRSYGAGVIQQALGSCVDAVFEARLRAKFMEAYVAGKSSL